MFGGVKIGAYFHTGRGLTIFSSNHKYDNDNFIPYDSVSINKPVIIKDFVWLGSNVVTRDIPDYAVIGGNPAQIIKYRDIDRFCKLKESKRYF